MSMRSFGPTLLALAVVSVGASASPLQAQQRSIINSSFEEFAPGYTPPTGFQITNDAQLNGWISSNSEIEIWASGFLSVPSFAGSYLIELNPNSPIRLAQEICLVENEQFSYSYQHRARAGGAATQTVELTAQSTSGPAFSQLLDTSSLAVPGTNAAGVWVENAGTEIFTGPTGIYSVGFQSTNSGSVGNLLDHINIVPIALVEFDSSTTQAPENEGSGIPQLRVSGVVSEDTIVTISVTGGSADEGDDFALDSTTITIPAGNYDGTSDASLFPAPITILNDSEFESVETLQIEIISTTSASGGAVSNTLQVGDIQCLGGAQTTVSHTILDAEPEIAVSSATSGPIADGGTDSFGLQQAGVPQTVTYTITNNGDDALLLGTPVIDGGASNVTDTSVSLPGDASLAPGSSTTITVSYTPVASGPFALAISVPNNDLDENPYNIALTGTAFLPPTANADNSLGNAIGTSPIVNVVTNDSADPDRMLDATSVALVDPETGDPVPTLEVRGQGTWSVDDRSGAITFAPASTLVGDPDPVSYTIADNASNMSEPALVTVTYTDAPEAVADESVSNAIGSDAQITVVTNDFADTGRTLVLATVALVDPTTDDPVTTLVVEDEGTWTVGTGGVVTFTPEDGFAGDPTDVSYTVADDQGNTSAPATIAVTYTDAPAAVADNSLGNAIGTAPEVNVLGNDSASTDRTLVPATVALVDPETGNSVTSIEVAGQGTWSVNPSTGGVIFTPLPTFMGNPAPVNYTVADDQGNVSEPTLVTVTYTEGPVAAADESLGNAIGSVPQITVTANDSAAMDRTIDVATVALVDPETGDPVTMLVVADQGTWSVGAGGVVTFVPEDGFVGNPGAVSYTVADDQGNVTAPATITVTYTESPVAVADTSLDNEIGLPVSLTVLDNDSADTGRTLDPTSVRFVDPATGDPVTSVTVPGQGVWSVSPAGAVTFIPDADFTGSPDPISYTVDDDQGNTSAPALITVGYEPAVNIEVIEGLLSDDLLQTTTMLSGNASGISRRAADRLNVTRGQACGDEINDLLRSNPIYFATDKFFIDARNNAVLDRIALILGDCPSARFMIAGHTDSRESNAYNLILSQNRVNAVKAALMSRGITTERLEAEGIGERRPVATNATVEGMALNRRVEFMLLDEDTAIAKPCGDADDPSGSINGSSDGDASRLNGNYRSTGYDCVTETYHEAWGKVSVTHDDDRGTMGMLSFGMSRERQANSRLFGQFVEGYLSKSDVDTAEANGTITGVGIHAGLFGANATESGLILSYYGSAAVGHHSFELTTIDTADGSYTYAGLFLGGAIGGEREYDDLLLKPRVGVDLAYAATLGSEISVPDVDLDIDPATYARAFAELGMEHALDDGAKVQFVPRAFCAITGTDGSDDCGFGAMFSYETMADDRNIYWDITADYEQIGSRQTATLSVARNVNILDDLGVSKLSFSATKTGAFEAGQAFEFSW